MLLLPPLSAAASCQWTTKFEGKYPVVGRIVDSSEPNSGSAAPTANGADGQTANPTTSVATAGI